MRNYFYLCSPENFKMKTLQPVIVTLMLFCISLTMQAQYVIVSGGGNSIGPS